MDNKNKKSGLIIALLGVVLLVGLGIYDMFAGDKEKEKKTTETTTEVVEATTTRAATTTEDANKINDVKSTATNATKTDAENEKPIDIDTKVLASLKDVKYIDIFYWEKFRLEGVRIRVKENNKTEFIVKTLDSLLLDETSESKSKDLLNITVEITAFDSNNNKIADYEIQDDIVEIKDSGKKYQLDTEKLGTLTEYIKMLSLTN